MALSNLFLPRVLLLVSLIIPLAVHAQSSTLSGIEPATTTIPETSAAGAPLQEAERIQLTDEIVDHINNNQATAEYAWYFAFQNSSVPSSSETLTHRASARCKTFPSDRSWPQDVIWNVFDHLLDGALIRTVPVGAACYDTPWGKKNEAKCTNVVKNFTNAYFHADDPTSNMWPIFEGRTCMPKNDTTGQSCTIGGFPEYAVKVTNVAQIQLAINFARAANLRLVIKNTGHCYLGKSLGAGALSLWTHNLKDIDFMPDYKGPGYSGPAFKLGAGVSVREVYEAAEKNDVTVLGAVSWSVGYAGGMITGGGQNPLAGLYGMAADHVVAFQVVTADGRYITVSEQSNQDLFWALRGGGGGTFAVVVSTIIRAHPKMNVVLATWQLDASTNGVDKFWMGVRKFYEVFTDWTDAGLYSFYIHSATPQLTLNMGYMFAPNHTLATYARVVKPFFDYLNANNVTLAKPQNNTQYPSFYQAYQQAWGKQPFPIGSDNSLPANRLVPRRNFDQKFNETFALIKEHITLGKHFLGYHNAPKNYANTNNAVHPGWRQTVLFLVTSSNRSLDHSTPAALKIANEHLQTSILQPWRDIAPVEEGGGVYLNEASVEEKDWQQSFYGGNYPRLSEIKRKWDPNEVFYAVTAVGSEKWRVEDGEMGVQTQNGRLCRV